MAAKVIEKGRRQRAKGRKPRRGGGRKSEVRGGKSEESEITNSWVFHIPLKIASFVLPTSYVLFPASYLLLPGP
ncbi:hypothetical protein A4H97_13250 [Niastella yeongjuensis]|uniref:Uncharacterized protein n=1 Tax=Niastella yeongjuensis TaxID=354355 RepID=A0A1V9EAG4_9BACT|nr:hypothetical protein A4H97_13250 [Niastella yeongjuensis]